ncbi:MAG: hypothetical protein Q8P83_01965 [bacterium]|nr:hypothetical protein [bacterium]
MEVNPLVEQVIRRVCGSEHKPLALRILAEIQAITTEQRLTALVEEFHLPDELLDAEGSEDPLMKEIRQGLDPIWPVARSGRVENSCLAAQHMAATPDLD